MSGGGLVVMTLVDALPEPSLVVEPSLVLLPLLLLLEDVAPEPLEPAVVPGAVAASEDSCGSSVPHAKHMSAMPRILP